MRAPARSRLAAALALLALAACSVLGAPSKVRAGELYAAGSTRYDAYFAEVHAQQVAEAAWLSERKSARKPLLDTLKLVPDADDVMIAQSAKDRLSNGVLRLEVQGTDVHIVEASAAQKDNPKDVLVALEQAAHAELARATKLGDVPARASALAKTGHELEAHIAEDFAGDGQKPFDVREELYASFDVLQAIAGDAERERRSAEQFVAELGRVVSTGIEAPVVATSKTKGVVTSTRSEAPARSPSKPARPTSAPLAQAPRAEPVAVAPRPPAPPKPAPKPEANEVFNP